jgi:hypothetical protein
MNPLPRMLAQSGYCCTACRWSSSSLGSLLRIRKPRRSSSRARSRSPCCRAVLALRRHCSRTSSASASCASAAASGLVGTAARTALASARASAQRFFSIASRARARPASGEIGAATVIGGGPGVAAATSAGAAEATAGASATAGVGPSGESVVEGGLETGGRATAGEAVLEGGPTDDPPVRGSAGEG